MTELKQQLKEVVMHNAPAMDTLRGDSRHWCAAPLEILPTFGPNADGSKSANPSGSQEVNLWDNVAGSPFGWSRSHFHSVTGTTICATRSWQAPLM